MLPVPGSTKKTVHYLFRRPLHVNTSGRNLLGLNETPNTWVPPTSALTPNVVQPGLLDARERVLAHLMDTWLDVPAEDWSDNCHLDPDNCHLDPDNKSTGTCCQLKGYNKLQKDKFKFDMLGLLSAFPSFGAGWHADRVDGPSFSVRNVGCTLRPTLGRVGEALAPGVEPQHLASEPHRLDPDSRVLGERNQDARGS